MHFLDDMDAEEPSDSPALGSLHGLVLSDCISLDKGWLSGYSESMKSAWKDMQVHSSTATDPAEASPPGFACVGTDFDLLSEITSDYLCYCLPAKLTDMTQGPAGNEMVRSFPFPLNHDMLEQLAQAILFHWSGYQKHGRSVKNC